MMFLYDWGIRLMTGCLQAWLRTTYHEYRQRTVATLSRSLEDCTTGVWRICWTWHRLVRDGAALRSTTRAPSALLTLVRLQTIKLN